MMQPREDRWPRWWTVALAGCVAISGCRGVIGVVLDLPPQAAEAPPVPGLTATAPAPGLDSTGLLAVRPRPPIEATLDPDSALALLPKDGSGRVDWMEALRTEVIRPRSVLPGTPEPPAGFRPQFEVLFQGPDSVADAVFPHAPHVEWLACEQCHSPVQVSPVVPGYAMITMSDVLDGELCGQCHGKVSFTPTGQVEGCQRCHPRLFPERESVPVAGEGGEAGDEAGGAPVDGEQVFLTWCAMCHGEDGMGDGPLGGALVPRPRDFSEALYQLRTTASGELPTDADMRRVIDEGIPGTAMPGWKNKLTVAERNALVEHLKTLSDYFDVPPGDPVTVEKPAEPPTPADLAAGKALFVELQCFKCHGDEGRGDGPSAPTLTDDWGMPIKPADLTKGWRFNGGPRAEDIYTRLRTGLDGTPMPSLGDVVDAGVISEAQLWQLAFFVESLSEERTRFGDIGIRMRRLPGPASTPGEDGVLFDSDDIAPALFPHWLHRIRFRCKVCHTRIFEPRAGANEITMPDIGRGEYCGQCHNGVIAFAAGFGECLRCHVEEVQLPESESVASDTVGWAGEQRADYGSWRHFAGDTSHR